MRQLVAGNWKMNGRRDSVTDLVNGLRIGLKQPSCDVLICPTFLHLQQAGSSIGDSLIMLGGQDCAAETDGAFTGDVSAAMLRDSGANWVILGHSERRTLRGETSAQVRAKAVTATKAGLRPIVAIGESLDVRDSGNTHDFLGEQLLDSLPDDFDGVVAYEPIWAIGTGVTPTNAAITETMAFIRQTLSDRFVNGAAIRILYGGSVTADNASDLLALPNVCGALVGGASLKADAFLAIVSAACKLSTAAKSV